MNIDMAAITEMVRVLGFPICMSLAMAGALYKTGKWFAEKIVERFMEAHLQYMKAQAEAMSTQTAVLHEMKDATATSQAEIIDELRGQSAELKQHSTTFSKWPSDPVRICKAEEVIAQHLKDALRSVLEEQAKKAKGV